jgi:hypothetical protein
MPSATYSLASDGAKDYTSDPFPVKIGNTTTKYTLKTDANVSNKNIIASKLSLQDTVTGRSGKTDRVLAESTDGGNTWIPTKGADGKPILSAEQQKALKPGGPLYTSSKQAAQASAKKGGATPEQQKQLDKGNNAATKAEAGITTSSPVSKADLEKDIATSAQGTRKEYTDVKYPLDLQANFQDCIKFAIIEYKPAGLGAQKSNGRVLNIVQTKTGQKVGDRKILGTITLPIPGGIVDQNIANWSPDSLNTIEKGFANVAQGIISGGADEGTSRAKESLSGATAGGTGAAEAVTTSKFTEMATGVNVLGRQYGAVDNPNMELLFSGPSLRSFSFTFKLSPRSEREAVAVKTIIRSFKQAMSAKRTESTLLLKSPFTFAISYISGDKQHPYLNKFKECALTNCSVNYTPYGTYMTYAGKEKSMVAYELQLQFQELEPLFDDEYGANDFDNIGF